ncbi:MAG: hypothetical protein AB7S56_08140 [Halothiobacillaceae bacterium]
MHASIVYLLTLLGVSLGIALAGIMGGVVGGVGFFLLHRVYTLSKRLVAIDEHLRHLDTLIDTAPVAPLPPELGTPAATSTIPEPQRPASPPTPRPEPTEPDPIVALNTTLQALLPALKALKSTAPVPEPACPTHAEPTLAKTERTETRHEPSADIEAAARSEAMAAAMAIEHVLLNALRNSELGTASMYPPPDKSLPLVHQAPIEAPEPTAHENTTHENMPTADSGSQNPALPPLSNDLEHLRDELTALMSDISAERARQARGTTKAPVDENPADAMVLQELLTELRRLTAKMPPPPQH